MIIKVYDNDINIYCCEEHMKMLCEMNNNNDNLISNPDLLIKIKSMLDIIEITFTSGKIIAIEQLKEIIPFF